MDPYITGNLKQKVAGLKQIKSNFEAVMNLSNMAKSDLKWWIANIAKTSNAATHGNA